MATTTYDLTGLTCGCCENRVRKQVSEVKGVSSVEVSAQAGRLIVTADGYGVDDAAVLDAVERAGFSATKK